MANQTFASVFDALYNTPAEAADIGCLSGSEDFFILFRKFRF